MENNPCGLDGFAFLEFSAPEPSILSQLFEQFSFSQTAKHQSEALYLYEQGGIRLLVNASNRGQAAAHARQHGPGACAMGFRVLDAQKAMTVALANGAKAFSGAASASHPWPAIEAIGGSVIYFVEERPELFHEDWQREATDFSLEKQAAFLEIDHLTHNVFRGNMDTWANFYTAIFNFQEIRYFNIEGKMTGLISRAMGSPCGKIKIPLNESKDDRSQIEEYLEEYQGEGIQHIALSCKNIYHSVDVLANNGLQFLDVPETYYEGIEARIPWQQEPIAELQARKILVDGEKDPSSGLLLQIFTQNCFGPVFFELIQRKGNQGFGEGNFQALFEAIERDQIRRGKLSSQEPS